MSLPELSVNQLLDPLSELLFIYATGGLHHQKRIQHRAYVTVSSPLNHLDEYGREVSEKIFRSSIPHRVPQPCFSCRQMPKTDDHTNLFRRLVQ
jgi:hypothetical protein